MNRWILGAVLSAAAITALPAAANTLLDTTTPGNVQNWSPFGVPDTSAYGETFKVGADNVLHSYSLYLDGQPGADLTFSSYLYAWDGSKATGPALYSSTPQTFSGSATPQEYAFNTGNLALLTGGQYVAFVFANSGNQVTALMPSSNGYSDVLADASFVYDNSAGDFGQLLTSNWDNTGGGDDVWFKADLGSGGAAPEPATWAMMLVGFFGMGSVLRRRTPVTA